MEMVDFQQYSETFSSPRPARRQRDSLSNNSLSNLFGDGLLDMDECEDYEILQHVEGSSDSDSDAVIDIEAIDELGSIMAIPDKLSTFSSARTAPINVLPPQKTSTTTEKAKNPNHDNELPKNSSRQVQQVKSSRTRHDSEQIVNDLVALHDTIPGCPKPSPSKLVPLPESDEMSACVPTLDQIQVDDSLNNQPINMDGFQLLGIEGIEAEDLESLFEQFEGATDGSPKKAASKILSPVRVNKTKSRPRPLTLEDYRRIRGGTSAASSPVGYVSEAHYPGSSNKPVTVVHSSQPVKPSTTSLLRNGINKVPDLLRQPSVSERKPFCVEIPVSGNKTALLRIPPPVTATTARVLQHIRDDHDYCCKGEPTQRALHAQSRHKQETQNENVDNSHNRDIKAELTMLLEKLPEYIAAVSSNPLPSPPISRGSRAASPCSYVVQEEVVATVSSQSMPSQSQDNCSCESSKSKSQVAQSSASLISSDEKQPPSLPKAYAKPYSQSSRGRGRARKRKYRRYQSSTAPSCSSSSSSSSEKSYVSDRSCERSCERQRCVSSSDSDSTSSSCDSCYSGASNISPSTKRKYRMVRKSRRKRSVGASTCRKSKKSRASSRSRSIRGRHKVKPAADSKDKRRRHKSGRSSQSVSPYSSSTSDDDRSRSSSPASSARGASAERRRELAQQAHQKAMSERRVVYVGGISERYTRADLRKRFGGFGEIEKVMIFLRENSENYGFVTFYSKADAHAAIEKGNDVFGPKFNLGFGGRRMFCNTDYADLDGCQAVKEEWAPTMRNRRKSEDDFDALLKRAMKKSKS